MHRRGSSQNRERGSAREVLAACSRGTLYINYHTLLGTPPIWQRESLKEEEREGGKKGEGGWAEASSQSLELWLWEKTFTLSSEKPSDRGGILSLSPLGLEKAAEGYFPRSAAKRERAGERGKKHTVRGDRGRYGEFWSFVGSRMWDKLEGRNYPKAAKPQNNNKTQTQPTAVTPCPTFSYCDFHNKNTGAASEAPPGHNQRYTVQVSEKETQYLKHLGALMSWIIPAQLFPAVGAAQNKQLSKGRRRAKGAASWLNERTGKKREKTFKEAWVRGPHAGSRSGWGFPSSSL